MLRVCLGMMLVTSASAVAIAEPRPGPLVLDAGEVAADLTLEVSLDYEHTADPVSLSPDLWWGVLPQLTIGVIHSDAAVDQLEGGATFCIHHTDLACGKTYRGSGVDVRWSAIDGDLAIAPRVRFVIRDLDPWKPAMTLGALARWTHHRFSITSDPYLRLGLANQQLGNRAAVFVPLWFSQQISYRFLLAIHTGFDSELAVIRDGYHVPISLVARYQITAHFDVGVEGGFTSAVGPQNDSSTRAVTMTIGWKEY